MRIRSLSFVPLFFCLHFSLEAAKVDCDHFAREAGFFHRIRRSQHYNVPRTEAIVQVVAGITAKTSVSVPEAMAEVRRWIDRYEAYDKDLDLLDGALSRFYGIPENGGSLDARVKGRMRIFREGLESGDSYPMTLEFPRAAHWVSGAVSLQRESRLLVQWTFKDRDELAWFLKQDEKQAWTIEKLKVLREIEQAELFSRLRRFRAAFPEGSYRRLQAEAKTQKTETVSVNGASAEAPPASNAEDQAYLTVRLFQEASRIINSKEDRYAVTLRPSQRAQDLIDRVTRTDLVNNYVTARSKFDAIKPIVMAIPTAFGWVQNHLRPAQAPIALWASLTVLVSTWGGWFLWTKTHVYEPTVNWIVYDREALQAKEYYDMLAQARLTISVPARTIEDFYLGLDRQGGFFKYCQDNFSDEAIRIAFEYLQRIRPTPEADAARDPKLDSTRLAGYSAEAKEIVKRRDALLFGYESSFGKLRGVSERLEGRQYNYFLVTKIIGIEQEATQPGRDGLKNSEGTDAPVIMGPPAPEKPKDEVPESETPTP